MLRITAAFAISLSVASFAFGQGTCSDNHILPSPPDSSGIQNIVFIMMENRSFDHFFGWVPNADGQQTATYYDDSNVGHPTHSLSGNPAAGGGNDPVHFYPDMHDTYWYYNNGAQIGYPPTGYGPNLGWLRQGKNTSQVAIGYYTQADLGFLGQIATQYTVLDKYFSSVLASTWPNRKFAHTGQTDLLDNHNPSNVSTLATIWDSLINLAPSVSAAYYWGDTNGGGSSHLFKFYGDKYQTGLTPPNGTNITKTYNQFLADAATGTLPNVAYVDPGACDDHPGNCDITQGDAWIQSTVNAVINGPQWQHAVVVVTFDEAGGFFDHVNPPRAAAPTSNYHPCMGDLPATCEGDVDPSGKVPLGFRVPTVVISPYSAGPSVNHLVYDHTSVLKMIEWRWNLANLTLRDGSTDIDNLACSLHFGGPGTTVKINFQPSGAPIPLGYLPDTGQPFADRGNGQSYGWSGDNTTNTRDRNNPNSPDQQHDTLAYMQRTPLPDAVWEIGLPNGTYTVRLVAGDPSFFGNHMVIAAEGVVIVDGTTSSTNPWLDQTQTVTVNDGRLTISNVAGADGGNKICFIEISQP